MHSPALSILIMRARLWRAANPTLPSEVRAALVNDLMAARREIKAATRKLDVDRLALVCRCSIAITNRTACCGLV